MGNYKLKIVHRRTRQKRVLTLEEFKKEFNLQLIQGINTYTGHKKSKCFLPSFMDHNDYKADFYFSLQFNFNNYCICEWYIERIL
ncbi:hypothetical protein J6I39_06665 [bacterium]|nr:hypothetical protein [bacterium]